MLLSAELLITTTLCMKVFIMKILSKVLFLSLTITGASYSMKNVENKAQKDTSAEDLFFQTNIVQLSKPIAEFVNDFKTWPKEEQDKIKIFNHSGGMWYVIDGKPATADKYPNGNVGYYLDCRLNHQQIVPFLSLLNYLKQQK